MIKEPLTLYKLIVLYMLDRVNFPLTKAQVMDFILDKEYTTFITLQQAISDLIDVDMIRAKSLRNRTHLEITDEGRATLEYFGNRIGQSIRDDIDKYFKENKFELKNELSVVSTYYKSTSGEYDVNMIIKEKNVTLLNLTMSVPTEDMAVSMCDKWENINQEVYGLLVEKLF
jgi:DNA-binding PadR family transcriptional regulator